MQSVRVTVRDDRNCQFCPEHTLLCHPDLIQKVAEIHILGVSVQDAIGVTPVDLTSVDARKFIAASTAGDEDDDVKDIAIEFENDAEMTKFHDGLKPSLREMIRFYGYPLWTWSKDGRLQKRPVTLSEFSDGELLTLIEEGTLPPREEAEYLVYIIRHRHLADSVGDLGRDIPRDVLDLLPNQVLLEFFPALVRSWVTSVPSYIARVLGSFKFEDRASLRQAVSIIMSVLQPLGKKDVYLAQILRRSEKAKRQVIKHLFAGYAQAQVQERMRKHARDLDDQDAQRKRVRKGQKCEEWGARCAYTPLDMEDWCEHDDRFYYTIDGADRCFDATELAQHFESQLTMTKYGNPYPQHPTDPWNRVPLSYDELGAFARFCKTAGLDLNGIAPTFSRFMRFLAAGDVREKIGKAFDQNFMERVIEEVVRSLPDRT
jgi:hypothetical protein